MQVSLGQLFIINNNGDSLLLLRIFILAPCLMSNLQIFKSIQEHNKVHPGLSINFGIQNIKQEKVITIEHVGEEKVFDVKMEDPFHNMVLNNFVVHNCGKSLTGKVGFKARNTLKINLKYYVN